jgi:hypothetical protein
VEDEVVVVPVPRPWTSRESVVADPCLVWGLSLSLSTHQARAAAATHLGCYIAAAPSLLLPPAACVEKGRVEKIREYVQEKERVDEKRECTRYCLLLHRERISGGERFGGLDILDEGPP